MFGFFSNLYKLLSAVIRAVRTDNDFIALLLLMATLLGSATLFYWRFEGWGLIDAFYFSVMTMSTIGYGDLSPTMPVTKLFTAMFSVLSIGVFAAVTSKLVVAILDRRHKRGHHDTRRAN